MELIDIKERNKICSDFMEVKNDDGSNIDYTLIQNLYPVIRKFDRLEIWNNTQNEFIRKYYSFLCDEIDKELTLYPDILLNLFIQVTNALKWYKTILSQKVNKNTLMEILNVPLSSGNLKTIIIESEEPQGIGLSELDEILFSTDYGFPLFDKKHNFKHKPIYFGYVREKMEIKKGQLYYDNFKILVADKKIIGDKIIGISDLPLAMKHKCEFITIDAIRYRCSQIKNLFKHEQEEVNVFDEFSLIKDIAKDTVSNGNWKPFEVVFKELPSVHEVLSKALNSGKNIIANKKLLQEHLHNHPKVELIHKIPNNKVIVDKNIFLELLLFLSNDNKNEIAQYGDFDENHIIIALNDYEFLKSF